MAKKDKTKFITKDIFKILHSGRISETGSALHDKKSGHVCRRNRISVHSGPDSVSNTVWRK